MGKFSVLGSIAIALVALLVIVEAEVTGESAERVFGGARAAPGQFPYQVSIRRPFPTTHGRHFCGGALISNRFVLTTANCTQGYLSRPSNVTVVVGTHLTGPLHSGTAYKVSKITNHPRFDRRTLANDISVIKTSTEVRFTNLVRPVKLPATNGLDGSAATFSGWGKFDVRSHYFEYNRLLELTFQYLYLLYRPIQHLMCHSFCCTSTRLYCHAHFASFVWVISATASMRTPCARATQLAKAYVRVISVVHWSVVKIMS